MSSHVFKTILCIVILIVINESSGNPIPSSSDDAIKMLTCDFDNSTEQFCSYNQDGNWRQDSGLVSLITDKYFGQFTSPPMTSSSEFCLKVNYDLGGELTSMSLNTINVISGEVKLIYSDTNDGEVLIKIEAITEMTQFRFSGNRTGLDDDSNYVSYDRIEAISGPCHD